MNKWLARLFVTASQVATTTGVTAAMIGKQAMLVQQGEIEHPKANGPAHGCTDLGFTAQLDWYVRDFRNPRTGVRACVRA